MSTAHARVPNAANSPSAPSTAFLIWRLTGGKLHATDATNASRTLLFNIHEQRWDDGPARNAVGAGISMLPEVLDCAADYGVGTDEGSVRCAEIPIAGVAGDQQSALSGRPVSSRA